MTLTFQVIKQFIVMAKRNHRVINASTLLQVQVCISSLLTWLVVCVSVSPGVDVHAAAGEGAVCVRLCAVQDLLALVVPGVLGLHSDLQQRDLLLLHLARFGSHLGAFSIHPYHPLLDC